MFHKNYLNSRSLISILPLLCVLLHYLPWLVLDDYYDPIWECANDFNGFFSYRSFLSEFGIYLSASIVSICIYFNCSKLSLVPILGMQITEVFWQLNSRVMGDSYGDYNSVWWISFLVVITVLLLFYLFFTLVILHREHKSRKELESKLNFFFVKIKFLKKKMNTNGGF